MLMIAKYCEFNAAKMYNEKKRVLYVACILLQSKKKKSHFQHYPPHFIALIIFINLTIVQSSCLSSIDTILYTKAEYLY